MKLKLAALLATLIVFNVAEVPEVWSAQYDRCVKGNTLTYHRSGYVNFPAGSSGTLIWNCPTNTCVVSGGWETQEVPPNIDDFAVWSSYAATNRQWRLRLRNLDNAAHGVRIYVVCQG
jgi:hypothetical protein